MAFTKNTDDLNIIQALPDEPNDVGGLTASQLKAKFDEAGGKLKTSLNGLVDELGATTAAANIGFASTTGVQEDNVQDAIENVQGQLAEISQGAVADGSITTAKLANGAVTAEKLASGVIGWRKLTSSEFDVIADTNVSSVNSVDAYYCEALGLVRFQLSFSSAAISLEPSLTSPTVYLVMFDDSKYYKPTPGEYGISGSVNSFVPENRASTARISSNLGIFVLAYAQLSAGGTVEVSGFYYTEDIPSGGES